MAVTVYDSNGKYVTALGRAGTGPGEIALLQTFLVTPQDSIILFDQTKMSVYSPSYQFVRDVPTVTPSIVGRPWVLLQNGNVVFQSTFSTPDRVGYPLHVLSRNGNLLRSFGSEVPTARPDRPFELRRQIGWAGGNLVWSAHSSRYQLELWDIDGTLRKTLIREASWFQPWTSYDQAYSSPRVLAVRQDSQGLLWTVLQIPDKNANLSQLVAGLASNNLLFHTLIEVIDPNSGTLIASRQFPNLYTSGFWSGSLLSSASVDAGDIPYVDIWQVTLRRP
jgi:hypothetical protein